MKYTTMAVKKKRVYKLVAAAAILTVLGKSIKKRIIYFTFALLEESAAKKVKF